MNNARVSLAPGRYLLLVTAVLGLLLSASVSAQEVTPKTLVLKTIESIRAKVTSSKANLNDPALDEELRKILTPVFDFREMARRSLGKNWNVATPSEQKTYVDLFSELLAGTYLSKVKLIDESSIEIEKERVKGSKAMLQTVVMYKEDKVSLDYRFFVSDNSWKVYDVIIEDISLVNNYRKEFAGIVRRDGMSKLISLLSDKLEKRRNGDVTEA